MSQILTSPAGAPLITAGPLTTSLAREAAPELLLSDIDQRIVSIAPSSTPLDQITRLAGARRAHAMQVAYYSVDTKPASATAKGDNILTPADEEMRLRTDNDRLFDPSETILVPDVTDADGAPLMLYVCRGATSTPAQGIGILTTQTPPAGQTTFSIPAGTRLVRLGRAAAELDVQTSQFQALPKKDTNNCQIFKAQVEESTLQSLTNKEVGWTFNDQEEVAVIDMRRCMERSFLFGHRGVVTDPGKSEDVMLTGGIWNQASRTFSLYYEADGTLTDEGDLYTLVRQAFEGQDSTRRKVLLGGADLMMLFQRLSAQRVVEASQTSTHWGITFSDFNTKFGTLSLLHATVFDECGMSGCGMVVDPEYLTKYSFIPMQAERLSLKSSGVRNTDAVVITEASCLVLRHPDAHLRIVAARKA